MRLGLSCESSFNKRFTSSILFVLILKSLHYLEMLPAANRRWRLLG